MPSPLGGAKPRRAANAASAQEFPKGKRGLWITVKPRLRRDLGADINDTGERADHRNNGPEGVERHPDDVARIDTCHLIGIQLLFAGAAVAADIARESGVEG